MSFSSTPDITEKFASAYTKVEGRVALLTNFIPPYGLPLLESLAGHIEDFRVFVSTPMESGRPWNPQWGNLDVTVLRNLRIHRKERRTTGFDEDIEIHIPINTLSELRRFRPNVIVACQLGARSLQSAIYTSIHRDCRLILWVQLSEHTELSRGFLRGALRKVLVPRADAILVNGNSGRRYIRTLAPDFENIFFVPYTSHGGVPPTSQCRNRNRIVFVGQLIERKGILPFANALDAWARANPQRTIEFLIVGDGPLRGNLEQLSLPGNLELRMIGNVPYQEIPNLLATSSILVFPTLADEWGIVVNEALAAGLPVLGSVYSQAVEELVRPGITGWHFRPDDRASTIAGIEEALSVSQSKWSEMSEAAVACVTHLRPERVAETFAEAIRSVTCQ